MAALNAFERSVDAVTVAGAVAEHGYAIVHDMLDAEGLARLRGELEPLIAGTPAGHEAFMGTRTVRFGRLLARSKQARAMALDPLLLQSVEGVLGPFCVRFQINYTGAMHLLPGEAAQVLHRDTGFYPFQNPAPTTVCATMWAVTDFTRENGATWLVPGSHLWDEGRSPVESEVVQAEMPAGSMLIYNGAVMHAGGANRSGAARTGCAIQFSLAWLRQEENQYMACPPEVARTFPRRLQELVGYDLGAANLGFVDHKHPNEVLNGTADDGPGDLSSEALRKRDERTNKLRVAGWAPMGRKYVRLDADLVQGIGTDKQRLATC